jgi:hypothetical protein
VALVLRTIAWEELVRRLVKVVGWPRSRLPRRGTDDRQGLIVSKFEINQTDEIEVTSYY